MAEERIRALVVDDDAYARRLIRTALEDGDIVVVAEAHDGSEAVRLCLEHRPDVVVMDVVMPVDGITATREIVANLPQQLVIVLTGAGERELGILALRAGAVGFLNKDVDVAALPKTLRGAVRGEAAISRELGMHVIEQLRSATRPPTDAGSLRSPLTAREWEVVELLDAGRTTDQIARALRVSRETVRSHVRHILRKLQVHSRGDAVALIQQEHRYDRHSRAGLRSVD